MKVARVEDVSELVKQISENSVVEDRKGTF